MQVFKSAFLPSPASFCTVFLADCGTCYVRAMCLNASVGGKQGCPPWKILLL